MDRENLTDGDWEEIYYALDRKKIEMGALDDEAGEVNRQSSETALWAAHLRKIMTKIASGAES